MSDRMSDRAKELREMAEQECYFRRWQKGCPREKQVLAAADDIDRYREALEKIAFSEFDVIQMEDIARAALEGK